MLLSTDRDFHLAATHIDLRVWRRPESTTG